MNNFLEYIQKRIDDIDSEIQAIELKYPTSGDLDDALTNGRLSRWDYNCIVSRIDRMIIEQRILVEVKLKYMELK